MPKYREITNMIREQCGIKVDDTNKEQFVLNKEEQVVVLATITALKTKVKNSAEHEQLIKDIAKEIAEELKEKDA